MNLKTISKHPRGADMKTVKYRCEACDDYPCEFSTDAAAGGPTRCPYSEEAVEKEAVWIKVEDESKPKC